MRINKLQDTPKKNRSALKKILVQLHGHEKTMKVWQERIKYAW